MILKLVILCRESASKLDNKIQRGLFIFAVSNSCMDPIVYGKAYLYIKHSLSMHILKYLLKDKDSNFNVIMLSSLVSLMD